MKWTEQNYQDYLDRAGADERERTIAENGSAITSVEQAKSVLAEGQVVVLPPRGKYNSSLTVYHCPDRGVLVFHSEAEWEVYRSLNVDEERGVISNLELQYVIPLGKIGEESIEYRADFFYLDQATQRIYIVDAKGYQTDTWKAKWLWARVLHPEWYFWTVEKGHWVEWPTK